MIFHKTKIQGLLIAELELEQDERGYFARMFDAGIFKAEGIDFKIVQVNRSLTSRKGTIRGMHFQNTPRAEDKVVACLQGAVYDVAVDLRKDSQTFGQWVGEALSRENKKMFIIPKGFAHGFQTLTPDAELQYFMSEFYSPEHARGVRWDDPKLAITWPFSQPILSDRDKNWSLIDAL